MICEFLHGFFHSFADRPFLNPQERILCSIAAVPDKWIFEAGMYTTGRVYRWFRDQMGSQEVALARECNVYPYALLDEETAQLKSFLSCITEYTRRFRKIEFMKRRWKTVGKPK